MLSAKRFIDLAVLMVVSVSRTVRRSAADAGRGAQLHGYRTSASLSQAFHGSGFTILMSERSQPFAELLCSLISLCGGPGSKLPQDKRRRGCGLMPGMEPNPGIFSGESKDSGNLGAIFRLQSHVQVAGDEAAASSVESRQQVRVQHERP